MPWWPDDYVSACAAQAAKAFYEDRSFKRSSVTVKEDALFISYVYGVSTLIACRIKTSAIPGLIAKRLAGEGGNFEIQPEFRFDEPNPAIARHLRALGVDAKVLTLWSGGRIKKVCLIEGRHVPCSRWLTLEEIRRFPKYEPPLHQSRPEFVNLTLPLFP